MPTGAYIEIVHDAPAQQLVVEIVVYLEEEICINNTSAKRIKTKS